MPLIAIPEPTSTDTEYNTRSLSPYLDSLKASGATPVLIRLNEPQDRVADILADTQGVLLPGSRFDVEPERYGKSRLPECGPSDPARAAVDELLLQDAFNLRKPVLAICHGMQTLNVWLNGTLVQDLPSERGTAVNHAPGRQLVDAHPIRVEEHSLLAKLAAEGPASTEAVNSSHHQAVDKLGDRLRVSAISQSDGIVEAIEVPSSDHFVLGVQWHPERTFLEKPLSREIFRAFVSAAHEWRPTPESVSEAAK